MEERGANPHAWAKAAKLKRANSLYNFLAGRSASLSQSTYEQLATVYGVSVSELTGDAPTRRGDERDLLTLFRSLGADDQARALAVIEALHRATHSAGETASKKAAAS